jgi:hypothetical protein
MPSKQPRPGPGRFQWNTGGWFGGQIGCTAWLLAGAVVTAAQAPWVAALWVLCWALANSVGTVLWLRRDRVAPYPAVQGLLASCAAAGLLAVVILHASGLDDVRLGVQWRDGALGLVNPPGGTLRPVYAALLLGVPAMMGWFAIMEWASRRERATT